MSKLTDRMKEYGIPDPPYLPKGKVVLVFRIPPEKVTKGGIVIPQTWTTKDGDGVEIATDRPELHRGILVAAGLDAIDEMADNLIEVGDFVHFGKYAGSEIEVKRDPENTGKSLTQMKIEDILGSVDAVERVKSHTLEFDDKEHTHYYEPKTTKRRAA